MRILYHHRTMGDGAEGIHIIEMINAFRELGHQVRVVCPSVANRSKDTAVADVENDGLVARIKRRLPVSVFRLIEVFYNCISYSKMIHAIWRWKPNFIYERYCRSNFGGVLAAKHCRIPHVLEVNTPYSVELKLYVGGTHHWLDQQLENFTLNRADRIATVSNALKDYLADQGVPAERMLVTPNAISPGALPDLDKAGARRQLGLPSNRLVIGFAGSMRRWHGIDFLMEVWPRIRLECPGDPFLLLIGDGELRPQVEKQVIKHGWQDSVRLVAPVPHNEIFRWMMAMDIGLMPDSNFYGSPMKIFEYMAMESVACAPRLGPLEEVIEHRKTGMLFQQRDPDSFFQAIKELADSSALREEIALASRQYVLENHRWIDNARRVIEFATQRIPG